MSTTSEREEIPTRQDRATAGRRPAVGRMRVLFATDASESAGAALRFLQYLIVPAQTVVRVVDWNAVVRQERPGAGYAIRAAYRKLAGKAIEVGTSRDGGERWPA